MAVTELKKNELEYMRGTTEYKKIKIITITTDDKRFVEMIDRLVELQRIYEKEMKNGTGL